MANIPREIGDLDDRGGRGQTETMGVVLLFAIAIVGSTVVVGVGMTSLDAAGVTSQRQATAHAMTQFDSHMAIVALGSSDVQSFSLGNTGSGRVSIDAGAGWLNITHTNRTGSGETETILNETLGAVVYENGETTIAYQGGGVWQGTGSSYTVVSPPEFHYRDATLTFPLIGVNGNGSVAGNAAGRIVLEERARRIFPNASASYAVGTPVADYRNPIENGSVTITIHSRYYEAWADYFRSRTTGDVVVHEGNETVQLELIAKGTLGDFEMPAEGNQIDLRGVGNAHPITNFTITLFDDDDDSANFANLKWSLYADEGPKQFEIHLRDNSGGACGGAVRTTIYYSGDGGSSYHAWTDGDDVQYECGDFDGDGTDEKRLVVNFTDSFDLSYEKVKGGDSVIMAYSVSGSDDFVDPTFDEHQSTVGWEPRSYKEGEGDREVIANVTNHYLSILGPSVDLRVEDKSGDTVNEDASTGTIEQDGGRGEFLTYLHITENRVRVEFE